MADSRNITRRTALKAAPAVAAALAVPVVALAGGETEVERLFREWKAGTGADDDDDDYDIRCAQLDALAAAPSTSARDMALKVLAITEYGQDWLANSVWGDVILAEMVKLTGETLPPVPQEYL